MIGPIAENRPPSAVDCPQKNKVILTLLVIFLTISLPLQVFAENEELKRENPVSNEEFLRESVRNLLDKAFLDFPRAESKFIFVNSEEENPANWLLEDELVSHLRSLNFQVALHPSSRQNERLNAWSLFYRIIQMELSYPQVKRKGFFGHKMVTRKAKLSFSFRLEEKESGKILWTRKETEERSDMVKKHDIKYLNNDSYSFLSPSLPEDTQTKYLEPALVAAVVGGLIYLFFASR
ncbi:MAG: hypothetical protein AMJ73_04730 [candidate division Zixibacteria bacterium SM1_73]|nr:MAG: hypothetical protein AMJ73_04730 [candidate division Zixibacteria bacterium SM1_73]